ncbi:glycine zipper 2TM domain-containing protein [Arcobacter aquimarinus]|uniref:glycine zipper 2TM domain-containing protein n=1 Tax=Arcobacter aquimarinus TaxID=1315211 RepID=UPI003BAE176A
MKKLLSILLFSGSLLFANNNSIGLDTLVGATIGVAIGNQIGDGNGRDVAKIAGGLLGAAIANNSRTPTYSNNNAYYNNNSYDNGYERSTTYVNNHYYNGYDRSYIYDRPSPQVTIVYQNYDRYYPKHHYKKHYHPNYHGHPKHYKKHYYGR